MIGSRFSVRHLFVVIATIVLAAPVVADDSPKKSDAPSETLIQVQLADDSVIKLTLLDAMIELQTAHGKLSIPASEIRKVDVGLRIADDLANVIRAAIADLRSDQPQRRETATRMLLKFGEKSYTAVVQASKSADMELSTRAGELLEKLDQLVPEDRRALPEYDVVHTDKSKIAGKIVAPTLNVRSFAFGDLTLKLSDVRAMSTSGFKTEKPTVAALPDPGSLTAYQQPQHVGKSFTFRVTGAVGGSVWGTGTYTLDSTLAAAAVHAGALKLGETGNVTVTILGPSMGFVGSTQNGVTSVGYDSYPGAYQIHAKRMR
jgi:hypothetical protein